MKRLERQQEALAALLKGGAFAFDTDIATVSYDEYQDFITAMQPPTGYSIGYDLGGVNWLENCHLDRDDQGLVEMVRRERTWQYAKMRAFQLELTTVPRLIMVTTEPNEPTTLSTTWYCDKHGIVRAYLQTLNGVVLEDIRT